MLARSASTVVVSREGDVDEIDQRITQLESKVFSESNGTQKGAFEDGVGTGGRDGGGGGSGNGLDALFAGIGVRPISKFSCCGPFL